MKFFIVLLSMVMSVSIFAQTNFNKGTTQLNDLLNASSDKDELLVWVFFNDKGDNTAHYFANPESVVSEKSLKRRAKVLPPDELISEMDLPVNYEYIEKVVSLGFEVKQKSKWLNGVSGYVTKSEIGLISQLSTVKSLDVVHKYKKDYSVEEDAGNQPQDNSLNKQNGINSYDYGQSFTQLNQIKVPAVHDMGYTGQGITICSMDAGFDNLAHEVFDSMNIIAMWDFVDNDPDVSQGGSHGTSTLSTIGGFKEGQLIGPAFSSDYILARTEDIYSETPVEEDNWIAALEWADGMGVDVTTTSLSYLDYDPPFASYTWEDMDGNTALITIAADLAVKIGIVVVNSASNSGYHPDHNTLGAPADGDSVFTVGAVTGSGDRASFSSVGPTVDGRIKPDVVAQGVGVYGALAGIFNGYGNRNGTSVAAPIASGIAALLLSAHPYLLNSQVRNILFETADNNKTPDYVIGYGLLSALDAVQFPNLQETQGTFTLHKMILQPDNIDPQTVALHYSTDGENYADVPMEFDLNQGYEFKLPFFFDGDLINFFFTYKDFSGTSFRDPVDDAYKFFYGKLNVSLNLDLQKEFDDFIVSNPFPNPFYPKTKVFTTVRVKSSGNEALNVIIVDALGQQVKKFNRITNEGNNDIIWEGDSEIGIPVASGPYYFLVNLNGKMYSRNLILLR